MAQQQTVNWKEDGPVAPALYGNLADVDEKETPSAATDTGEQSVVVLPHPAVEEPAGDNGSDDASFSVGVLDLALSSHPRHFAALALGPLTGPTVADSTKEAIGPEPLDAEQLELMRDELRTRAQPLTEEPTPTSDFSLSLSNRLIHTLTGILNQAADASQPHDTLNLVLSVGCGTGLLEAHLQSHWSSLPARCKLQIHGVEVRDAKGATPNRYLPFKNCSSVRGTWEVSARLLHSRALMFVYPRAADLIKKYLEAAEHDDVPLQVVVWLGPKNDWKLETSFRKCFEEAPGFGPVETVQDCGLVEYEMMAVIRRAPT